MRSTTRWLLSWIVTAVLIAAAAAWSAWFADPDGLLARFGGVLYAPGGSLYILSGCNPHSNDCGPILTIILLFVTSGLAWATALVGLPWIVANNKRRRAASRAA